MQLIKKQVNAVSRFHELVAIQMDIADNIRLTDTFVDVNFIGAADQAFYKNFVMSCVVVLDKEMKVVDQSFSLCKETMPYIPGLLSFREGPPIIEAFRNLRTKPDVLLIDGCGINHFRSAGLATYVGITLNIPTIGVSKKKLCGDFIEPVEEGEVQKLTYKNETVGFVFKSKQEMRPIFISPGTGVSVESSLKISRDCLIKHKLPEPIRIAHSKVNELKRDISKQCCSPFSVENSIIPLSK